MRVHTCLAMSEHRLTFDRAMAFAQMELVNHRGLQSLCTALYREPDAIGAYWSIGVTSALMTAQQWRRADMRNLLLCLLPLAAYDSTVVATLLNVGVDDVQEDGIDPRELAARLKALSVRTRTSDPLITFCGVTFDPSFGTLRIKGACVNLSRFESELLHLLIRREATVVTKSMIMDQIYQGRDEAEIKIVDVFICKLRAKLDLVCGGLDVIETIWGRGYRFVREGFPPRLNRWQQRTAG